MFWHNQFDITGKSAREVIELGIEQFERYAEHLMSCYAWGPGAARRHCTCGLDATIEAVQRWLLNGEGK